jgi:hypothetical protein
MSSGMPIKLESVDVGPLLRQGWVTTSQLGPKAGSRITVLPKRSGINKAYLQEEAGHRMQEQQTPGGSDGEHSVVLLPAHADAELQHAQEPAGQ